jgi:hypothetical protein
MLFQAELHPLYALLCIHSALSLVSWFGVVLFGIVLFGDVLFGVVLFGVALKGHDFSRAANVAKSAGALAPEGPER